MKAKSDPLILRAVETADIAPLAQLWFDGWHLGHAEYAPAELTRLRTLDSFETRIRESLPNCFTAGSMGAPIAFTRIFNDEIDQFYVDPNATGQGLGKNLMHAVEAHLRTNAFTTAHLFCAVGNTRAEGFYEKMGWINKGVTKEEFETSAGPFSVPVIRFEKTLNP